MAALLAQGCQLTAQVLQEQPLLEAEIPIPLLSKAAGGQQLKGRGRTIWEESTFPSKPAALHTLSTPSLLGPRAFGTSQLNKAVPASQDSSWALHEHL